MARVKPGSEGSFAVLVGQGRQGGRWVAVQWPRVNRVLSPIDFILAMLALFGIGLLIGIYWPAAW